MMVYELKGAYATSAYEEQLKPFILRADFDSHGFQDLIKLCGHDEATTNLLNRIEVELKRKSGEIHPAKLSPSSEDATIQVNQMI